MRNALAGWLFSSCVFAGAVVGCSGEGEQPTAVETALSQGQSQPASQLAAAPAYVVLDVPYVEQKPELPRGCEVTSLAMLLNYLDVDANKMTLASEIEKVPYWVSNGVHGNPYDGFVGDMYDSSKDGFGAYHGPVKRLADTYLPNRIRDLTGNTFDSLLTDYVGKGRPVWVITNARFVKLADSQFETWHTTSGDIRITWHEHSVVITGFDTNYVYINDPLGGKSKRLGRQGFREAWEQMGKQAISYDSSNDCFVRSDGRLHCNNVGGSSMYASTTSSSSVVDHLRTTYSWFDCWGTGERHAGGNTTWYHTQGDDNAKWGWIPAVNLNTTSAFDADPSAQGLQRCQP
ncbi:C39 family peptidase [Pendulispora rubella]|uniref:C39 family peptidase n=1 Tax=Pendulispora rubella TaxID=2741070 RepID=A0ABZ2KTD7_9BACT